MNKQLKLNPDGTIKSRGIEWCQYTWNPIGGCLHACQWRMPDGKIANCYAEDVAEGIAQSAYPEGFEHHYWKPNQLTAPRSVKQPSKVFWGSMADNFGHWVPAEQLQECFDAMAAAPQHTFQALTKNPKRMAQMQREIPGNVWCGASSPPDFMHNKPMTPAMQEAMLERTLFYLSEIHRNGHVTWMSAEPLSWDISSILRDYYTQGDRPLDWVVIGAASDGPKEYPPNEGYVRSLVELCGEQGIAIFMKGNLRSLSWARDNWREDFPK